MTNIKDFWDILSFYSFFIQIIRNRGFGDVIACEFSRVARICTLRCRRTMY